MKNLVIQNLEEKTYQVLLNVSEEIVDVIVLYHQSIGRVVHVRDVKIMRAARVSDKELGQVKLAIVCESR